MCLVVVFMNSKGKTDNQQGSLPSYRNDPSETTRRAPKGVPITKAYLLGLLHDATERDGTFRVAQKSKRFLQRVAEGIKDNFGVGAWIYKEGKNRNVFVLEFSKSLLGSYAVRTEQEKIDYIRGFFDADGGIAKSSEVRFYLYFAQKNLFEIRQLREYLLSVEISCGVIHNPSKKVDPDYWRFYISTRSHSDFARKIGSFHPDKWVHLREKI